MEDKTTHKNEKKIYEGLKQFIKPLNLPPNNNPDGLSLMCKEQRFADDFLIPMDNIF